MKTISNNAWEKDYQPVINTHDDNACFNGQMFETYGQDHKTVISVATRYPRRVWTLVESDDEPVIINGYHHINRVGYFITTKEWPEGATIDVVAG